MQKHSWRGSISVASQCFLILHYFSAANYCDLSSARIWSSKQERRSCWTLSQTSLVITRISRNCGDVIRFESNKCIVDFKLRGDWWQRSACTRQIWRQEPDMLCLKFFTNEVPRKHFEVLTITVALMRRLQVGLVCCKLNAERAKQKMKWL